jgi:hypothetical protein
MKTDLVVHILESIKSGGDEPIPPCSGHTEQEITNECCRLIDAGLLEGSSLRDEQGVYRGAAMTGITRAGIDYLEERKGKLKTAHPLHKASQLARDAIVFLLGAVAGGVFTKLGEYLFDLLKTHLPQ